MPRISASYEPCRSFRIFLTVNAMIDSANNYGHCLLFKHVIALKSTALNSFKLKWPESQLVMNLVGVSEFF